MLNKALSDYGPENLRAFPRVTIKEWNGQQTEIDRINIKVASFSGINVDYHPCIQQLRPQYVRRSIVVNLDIDIVQ